MRIGILTFHRAHNYGAVLQCFALQEYLKGQGHDISVIDYEPRHFYEFYNWFHPELLKVRNPLEFVRRIKLLIDKKRRYKAFDNFIEGKLRLCKLGTIFTNPFDVVIVGSDQVWNYSGGFDPYYWGAIKFPKLTKVVSYAASMQDKWEPEVEPIIKQLLENFDKISVRESSLRNSLVRLTGNTEIKNVVDPTLLLSTDDWVKVSVKPNIQKPYLLLYLVQYSAEADRIAHQIAKEKNLELVYLTTDVDAYTHKAVRVTAPEQFVGLFQYADFVVSASFHGTVFSLQFNKPFFSYKMGIGRDARVASLLAPLGLSSNFSDQYEPNQDYSCKINSEGLKCIKNESFDYLQQVTSL